MMVDHVFQPRPPRHAAALETRVEMGSRVLPILRGDVTPRLLGGFVTVSLRSSPPGGVHSGITLLTNPQFPLLGEIDTLDYLR
jgi:hypothetical protein